MNLILASSSPYRKQLLTKLGVQFSTYSPNIDESRQEHETPLAMVSRLSQNKALEVAKKHHGLIIASDQVATLQQGDKSSDEIFTKPHTHEVACTQLAEVSAKKLNFLTALTLLNTKTNNMQTDVVKFSVIFKKLNSAQIDNYLKKERPYNCAASFKSEALGVALLERFVGDDPNSIIGLPVITLIKMLNNEGIDILNIENNSIGLKRS